MDRRKAIKRIGLSLGYVVATPVVIGLLQSCNIEKTLSWKPKFFTLDESLTLENLIDQIVPRTESLPGALDVNIPKFIDSYLNEVANKKQQLFYKNSLVTLTKLIGKPLNKIESIEYNELLSKYLKANKNSIKTFTKNELLILEYLTDLRDNTIWAYRTSEQVGEEILAYDPIPGEFQGCISLIDATEGKAWSL